MAEWFAELEEQIFTQVDYMLTLKPDAPFPNLTCTTANQNSKTVFPTLYLHELEPVEAGQDLNNQSVNAVVETIEIQVWTNETEEICREILSAAITEMKRMRFNVTGFPNVHTDNKIALGIARFRRLIGQGDSL